VRMRVRKRAWLCGVFSFVASTTAAAQDTHPYPECTTRPSEGDIEGAMGAFKAGKARYDEGNRERAILYWEDAYRMDCTAHDLLVNLATAYELHGNKEQALVALQAYLLRVPDSKKREQVTRRIELLQTQLDAEKKREVQAVSPQAQGATAQTGGAQSPQPAGRTRVPRDDQGAGPDSTGAGKRPLVPLIVAGVGAAVAVVGAGVLVVTSLDLSKYTDECGPDRNSCKNDETAAAANAAANRQAASAWVTGGGLAVAAGGLAWYFLSKPESKTATSVPLRRSTPALAAKVDLGHGYAGLRLSGAF
jgi:tetratricopeptide (TPR) repeat protein